MKKENVTVVLHHLLELIMFLIIDYVTPHPESAPPCKNPLLHPLSWCRSDAVWASAGTVGAVPLLVSAQGQQC